MKKKLNEMKKLIAESVHTKQKSATVHALIILNVEVVQPMDWYEVCEALDIPLSYSTEVKKAINTANIMKAMGYKIVKG